MNSQTGHIGFGVQAAQGTFEDPAFFTLYSSDSIGLEGDPIIPSPEIGGGRYITSVYPGPLKVSGGMNLDVRPEVLGLVSYLVSGTDVPELVESGVYKHVIQSANTIPWFSAQKKVSDTYDVYNYTDLKMNSLTLSAQAGQQLTAAIDLRGLTESGGVTPVATSFEDAEVFMWHSGEVKLEDTTICPLSFNIEFNNNLDDTDWRICPNDGRNLHSLHEKRFELNASVTIRPEDNDLYEKAVYGESGAEVPTKQIYSGSFWVKLESVGFIGSTSEHYYVEIDVGKCFFMPFKIEPDGDNPIEHELRLVGAKDGTNPLYTINVQNDVASYTA